MYPLSRDWIDARQGSRFGHWLFLTYCFAVLTFLVLPLLVVVTLSFSPSRFFVFPPTGVSLRWYAELLNSVKWRSALMNSLVVGTGASAIATTFGLLAAWGLSESKSRIVSFVSAWLVLPMAVPIVIVAVACFIAYSRFGLAGSRWGLMIAHAALGLPFVVIAVSATLKGFNRNLSRAAQSLGASPAQAFRTITVPAVMPGILTGALFAYAVSFDEVVVALFLSSAQQHTLPVEVFSGTRESISPTITAVASLLMIVSVMFLVLGERLRRA